MRSMRHIGRFMWRIEVYAPHKVARKGYSAIFGNKKLIFFSNSVRKNLPHCCARELDGLFMAPVPVTENPL
ncbi:MAG: hypothetical protein NTX50_03960 [Candidatus Sumerlaeota bacterium]|nr:hypothetical protein [Candidatus Sumerlaeota bacterium]